ncbi:hypothetical protein B7P43_G02140, partial [Cryptotermes secundus]
TIRELARETGLAHTTVLHILKERLGMRKIADFDLIPKMKEPLRGIRFRTVPEILQAVDRSIPTINTTGAAKGILRLPHRWQRVVHNAGDYIEGQ